MDNQRLFACALHARLEQDPRFEIVAVAEDSADAVRLVEEKEPDIVLLDTEMPRGDALKATRLISANDQAPRVLILADAYDRFDAGEAHDAGAAAFLRRPRSAADLLETLQLAAVLIGASVSEDEAEDR
jgi:DNA-binding NarL/FixJ family response regulator